MISSIILLFLTFAGTLYLEAQLTRFVLVELGVIVFGVLVALVLLAAESSRARWAWPAWTIFYALGIANLAGLFVSTNHLYAFLATLFIALVAFIRAVSRLEENWELDADPVSLETYEVDGKTGGPITPDTVDPIIVQTMQPPRQSTRIVVEGSARKKSSRKKSTRKKASRKNSSRKKSTRKKASRKKSSRRKR